MQLHNGDDEILTKKRETRISEKANILRRSFTLIERESGEKLTRNQNFGEGGNKAETKTK